VTIAAEREAKRRDPTVDAFVELLARGTPAAVRGWVEAVAAEGRSPTDLVVDVLGPAQAEVGRRWSSGRWGAAHAGRASALAEVALAEIARRIVEPEADEVLGHVVVACAESEGHLLPAQMGAEVLRVAGYEVDVVAGPVPAPDLLSFVHERRPDVVVVTCTLASSFVGARRSVDAAHLAGRPVVLAGRAVTPARASALGAEGGAADARDVAEAVEEAAGRTPRRVADRFTPYPADVAELLARRDELVDRVVRSLGSDPGLTGDPWQSSELRQRLAQAVEHLAAARLVQDPSVMSAFADWWAGRPVADNGPTGVTGLLERLAETLGQHPAHGLAELAATRVRAAGVDDLDLVRRAERAGPWRDGSAVA